MGAVGAAARHGKVGSNSTQTTLSTMGDDAKLQEIQKLGGTAIKPVGWDRTGWEAFQYMLWNPDTGEVLTRTPLSWLKITVFYCIYYSCLAGFWIACMNIFFATLPEVHDGPRWLQKDSIIGVNPGVGLRPRNTDARIDSQMFVLRQGDTNTHESELEGEGDLNADYVARTEKFLEIYDDTNMGKRTLETGEEETYPVFNLEELGDCNKENKYGYVVEEVAKGQPPNKVRPCIFIKLNTIWGWTPKPYDCAAEKKKGKESEGPCLEEVEKHITAQGADALNNVYINCAGRYAADKEALEGGLEYFPKNRGLPISYFPYQGKGKGAGGNFHAPLVAVRITPKEEHAGQLIHIECRAYYEGVKHVTKTKEGMVMFELQIKDD